MAQQMWERYEMDFLIEVASTMTLKEISEKLERTEGAIKNKASYLGITLLSAKAWSPWTPEQAALFSTHSDKEISLITGRTVKSVCSKRYQLKIYRRAA
ncbi:hypothetical protein [Rahnella woolbedingensis]|uniref:Uncharacterized protein n=1 Tax=Rahnella woolbedingensis TaxID=1510574 RepID=A0A419NEP7_9GAMM|nr:hypothetical protein [Rahnella woolbedingensis]RJT47196.1 hypothetical protein D6C13_02210 [Rahnella woolbedingensis]